MPDLMETLRKSFLETDPKRGAKTKTGATGVRTKTTTGDEAEGNLLPLLGMVAAALLLVWAVTRAGPSLQPFAVENQEVTEDENAGAWG